MSENFVLKCENLGFLCEFFGFLGGNLAFGCEFFKGIFSQKALNFRHSERSEESKFKAKSKLQIHSTRLPTRGSPKSQILTARVKAFRFILRFDFAEFLGFWELKNG